MACVNPGRNFDFIDEIHNDFENQCFWPTVQSIQYDWHNEHYYDNIADPVLREQYLNGTAQPPINHTPPQIPDDLIAQDPAESGVHGQLKAYVRNNVVWYIKIHSTKTIDDMCNLMLLFCVGVSPNNPNNLVGIVAGQAPD